jgi:V/A-type H+/Na+-transporting ATPase subunit E
MPGIDAIVEKILEDAETKREDALSRAMTEASERKRQLEVTYQENRKTAQERAEERARQTYQRLIAGAMLEGRKLKLAAWRESVDEAFEKAMDRLCAMPEDQYVVVMARLAVPCLAAESVNEVIPSDSGIIGDYTRLLNTIQSLAPGKTVALGDGTVPSRGGIVIKNGKVQSNLTFETLIRLEKNRLEAEVMRILFEGSE